MSGDPESQPPSVTDPEALASEEKKALGCFRGGRAKNLFNYIILVKLFALHFLYHVFNRT